MERPKPLVVVTVGTDHHPFPTLIGWMDAWAASHPEVRCVIQYGMSPPPRDAEGIAIIARPTLLALMSQATAVVSQAGPGSIRDARQVGLVPIVTPRSAARGEVVDDHQVDFAEAMVVLGEALLARTLPELERHLAQALADPESVRKPPHESPAHDTAMTIDHLLQEVTMQGAGWLTAHRLLQAARPARRHPRGLAAPGARASDVAR